MKKTLNWDNVGYIVLFGLIAGQIAIGFNFVLGEAIYILTDLLILTRDFKLKRPKADIIKNAVLTVLASGALIANLG